MFNLKKSESYLLYQMVINAAGKQAAMLKKCLLLVVISSILQGIAFFCFIPFFVSLENIFQNIYPSLTWLAIIFLLLLLSSILRWQSYGYEYDGYGTQAGYELRTRLGIKLRKIPLQILYQRRTGELNTAIGSNVDEVVEYTMMVTSMLINAVVLPVTVGLLLFVYDWKMACIILLTFPFILPLYKKVQPTLTEDRVKMNKSATKLNSELIEYAQGITALKVANGVDLYNSKLGEAIQEVEQVEKQNMAREGLPNFILASAVEFAMLLIIILGSLFVSNGWLDAVVLAAVVMITIRFAEPISIVLALASVYEMIKVGYQKLAEINAIEPLEVVTPNLIPDTFDIEFKHLTFSYLNAAEPTLKDINLIMPQRTMTALVGPSGCGKSTLIRLIMRYADPQIGEVCIGGINIKQILPDDLMKLISVVFQDVYLFDDTIINNIRMAKPEASEAEVYLAAEKARCHDFIEKLPHGYQTRVGEIGGNLSGGEKQRISIARALLKDTPIIILDEPTASLDTESEVVVQQAIDELVRNKTVIVIAHRLSTIMAAQNIVFIEHGTVIEQGTHDELLANYGRYFDLWTAQQGLQDWHLIPQN